MSKKINRIEKIAQDIENSLSNLKKDDVTNIELSTKTTALRTLDYLRKKDVNYFTVLAQGYQGVSGLYILQLKKIGESLNA